MDIRMPLMDGYEATQFIRSETRLKTIPVIALTASVNVRKPKENQENLFQGILYKPVTVSELHRELTKYLKYSEVKKVKTPSASSSSTGRNKKPKQVPALIRELEGKFMRKWDDVMNASNIGSYELFSKELEDVAVKYNYGLLKEYAERLAAYARGFDIENIQIELRKFPHLVEKLKTLT